MSHPFREKLEARLREIEAALRGEARPSMRAALQKERAGIENALGKVA